MFAFESRGENNEKEDLRSQVDAIRYMLDEYAKPHMLVENPHVLIVGMHDRFAEAFAIVDCFDPEHITAVDIASSWVTKMNYLMHVLYERPKQIHSLVSSVSIKQQNIEKLDTSFDIVCAFSLSPFLQNQDAVNALLRRSHGISVITARKSSGIFWNKTPEHLHIDQLIEGSGKQLLVRDRRLSLPTSDGYLWVVSSNEN